ncbi:MAG: TolC family protein [Candidatus Igneacidithiobacillus chanchocoensis]
MMQRKMYFRIAVLICVGALGFWAGAVLAQAAILSALEAPALPSPALLDERALLRLPTLTSVEKILAEAPALKVAQAQRQAAQFQADALRRGSNEFSVWAQVQSRDVRSGPDQGRYSEWQTSIQRPIRWPAQGTAANSLGKAMLHSGEVALGDARHESLREMLRMLVAVQRSAALAQLSTDAVKLLAAQVVAVEKRQAAGDASLLELDRIRAEAAQEEAMATQDRAHANAALAAWQSRYPDIPALPQSISAALPPVDADRGDLLRIFLQHNHELALLDADWQKSLAQARQARTQELPQPTVGVYLAAERGGNESIVGLQVSMPIPSASRKDQTAALQAEATAARWRLTLAHDRLQADFLRRLQEAQGLGQGSAQLQQAYQAQWQASQRAQKAYFLGESSLNDWLQSRRLGLQSAREWMQSRFEAEAASAEILLDTHRLWATDPIASSVEAEAASMGQ